MKLRTMRTKSGLKLVRFVAAITCAVMGVAVTPFARARPAWPGATPPQNAAAIPTDQLDALVAPIALFADNLLSQTLVASTYPLEIVQLQQWLQRNAGLVSDQ